MLRTQDDTGPLILALSSQMATTMHSMGIIIIDLYVALIYNNGTDQVTFKRLEKSSWCNQIKRLTSHAQIEHPTAHVPKR